MLSLSRYAMLNLFKTSSPQKLLDYEGKPQKKFFFSGPTTKASTPPPWLIGHRNFWTKIYK